MDDKRRIQATLEAFYRTISGSGDVPRDAEALNQLFCEGAQVTPLSWNGSRPPLSATQYVNRLKDALDGKPFFERGLDYRIETVGSIAQVRSRYEASESADWLRLSKTGTSLVQLVLVEGRWRILSMLYADDSLPASQQHREVLE